MGSVNILEDTIKAVPYAKMNNKNQIQREILHQGTKYEYFLFFSKLQKL